MDDLDNVGLSVDSLAKWQELLTSKGHEDTDLLCVFKPRVQVLDNWGWCTGSCDYKDGGCYSEHLDEFGITNYDCDPDYNNSWLEYDDVVVVAP